MDMELGTGMEDRFLSDASNIAKGKRTKRQRPLSPCDVAAAAITSSSSTASFSSTTTTFEDEEEADMANCLILLAQGKTGGEETDDEDEEEEDNKMREKSRRISEVTTTTVTTAKIGFYIYECKTCNRTFPSFQALGGHRASHKKPKLTSEDKKKSQQQLPQPPQPNTLALITNCDFQESKQASVTTSPPVSLQLGYGGSNNNNSKAKIHECSICGSEFTSGQALGGHMRRHRTPVIGNTTPHHQPSCDVAVKPLRSVLELDLNLPAPADDDHHRDSKFQFAATQKTMMLSAAPPLVDCHY